MQAMQGRLAGSVALLIALAVAPAAIAGARPYRMKDQGPDCTELMRRKVGDIATTPKATEYQTVEFCRDGSLLVSCTFWVWEYGATNKDTTGGKCRNNSFQVICNLSRWLEDGIFECSPALTGGGHG